MKREDFLEALGGVDGELLERSEKRAASGPMRQKWAAAAACICLVAGACALGIPRLMQTGPTGPTPEQTQPAQPAQTADSHTGYDPDQAVMQAVIGLSGCDRAAARTESTYSASTHDGCKADGRPESEAHGAILEPYCDGLRYVDGRFYARVVLGYDPDYTVSACGGWHYEDALEARWYAVDLTSGTLAAEPEPDAPGEQTELYIFDTDGQFQNVCWTSAEMEEKGGYYCVYNDSGIQLWREDPEGGADTLVFTDTEYSGAAWVEAVGSGYVVYAASQHVDGQPAGDDYRVVQLEEPTVTALPYTEAGETATVLPYSPGGEVVMTLPYVDGEVTYNALFIHDGGIYCDSFRDYNGTHELVRVDIDTGEKRTVQSGVPTRNMRNLFISGDYALADVTEGYGTEGQGGIYLFDLTADCALERLAVPETCGGLPLSSWEIGTVLEDALYFSAVYAKDGDGAAVSVLYRYDVASGTLEPVFRADERVERVIYAGTLYCAYSRAHIYCGALQ